MTSALHLENLNPVYKAYYCHLEGSNPIEIKKVHFPVHNFSYRAFESEPH